MTHATPRNLITPSQLPLLKILKKFKNLRLKFLKKSEMFDLTQ